MEYLQKPDTSKSYEQATFTNKLVQVKKEKPVSTQCIAFHIFIHLFIYIC